MKKLVCLVFASALGACTVNQPGPVDQRNSALTQGNVQMNLVVGSGDRH